ncbi:hypothetical protein Bca52824_000376 [Brassica carinata]|uniref:Uncharacterized protein n=1 Tax=Brassica carinata TaxID=52824 RepID=A0A8X7WGF4_BRACI|nr:hypothetical protein Bca52824_000376 [Brassica carinata]
MLIQHYLHQKATLTAINILLILKKTMNFWRNKGKERRKQWFLDNGSTFLKELIAGCNGKTNPIRSFSFDQILKATNGFDPSLYVTSDLYYTWFTGSIEDRSYMIKMYPEEKVRGDGDGIGAVYNDIVISARLQEKGEFIEIIYRVGVRDIVEAERFKVDKFVELTFRCCERSVEKRPKMIDVAKELKRIQRSLC